MSNVVEQIVLFQKKLEKYSATKETDKLLYYIHKLKQLNIRVSHLEITGVGRTVNALRQQHKGIVADKAKALVNKWKDLLTEEDEEEEYEAEEEDEEYDGHQSSPVHPAPQVPEARDYATEDQESDNGGEEEDDGRLQIEEEQDYPDNHHGYSPTETKANMGYSYQPQQHDSDSGQEDSYNPLTSQRDYLRQSGPVANEYHPSSCSRVDSPDVPSSPQWRDASSAESSDRKNGSSPRASSSKKSSKGNKERSKDKEKHKDRGKDKHKESSRSHEKEKKKERKEKHKHRDKEEKKEEKKSHKDKHREKDKHSEKVKEKKHKSEEYNEKPPILDTPDERYMANGFSSPEVEERSYSNKKESRESDKRGMDEKRKEKSDKSISIAPKRDDSSHRDDNTSSVHKENRLSDGREGDRTAKYSGREKENISSSGSKDKGKEKKREERHRDKDQSKSDKKERHSKESEESKVVDDKSSSSSKDKVKKKSKAELDAGFGAALMGLDSPVKKKKKKKKKESERERESSDDEKPSTSSSFNKRVLVDDDGEQSSPKKPKLLALPPQKLPKLPSFVQDDAPFLPEITPNYKPLPRVAVRDEVDPSLGRMTDEEAWNFMFQSKNKKRSKMYSGKASGLSYVPSLYESCIRVLQENIDALEATGGIPFEILRPVLERADPKQLMALEDYNSYLLEDTNILWEVHCKKDFRNKRLEEMETWRDMWIRMSEERDFKLKSITQNLQKKFVSNSEPKRTTKLAFVDSIIKVPKNVARAQAKYGTAPTPAAAIAAAKPTKANEAAARKTAMLNVQRVERTTTARPPAAAKKRVAPLMAKTRQFYKKAFRR